jgi:hypothetical protein
MLTAQTPTAGSIIERARKVMGPESALGNIVTLRIEGQVKPSDPKLMPAKVILTARKPCSQRLEIYVDDILETTILHGGEAVLIRSHEKEGLSQMRVLSDSERQCLEQSTRNMFNFYSPDLKNGELARYDGISRYRGKMCDLITYTCPGKTKILRYFSRKEAKLVATIREVSGEQVEIVEEGDLFVDGVRFPRAQLYFQDRRPLHRMEVDKVLVNSVLKEGIFDIPEQKK